MVKQQENMKKSICNYSIIVLILFSLINCREKKKSNNQHVIINKNEVLVSDLISNDSVIIAVIGAKTCTNQYSNTFCKLYDSLSITKNLYIVYSDKDKLECLRNKEEEIKMPIK